LTLSTTHIYHPSSLRSQQFSSAPTMRQSNAGLTSTPSVI